LSEILHLYSQAHSAVKISRFEVATSLFLLLPYYGAHCSLSWPWTRHGD